MKCAGARAAARRGHPVRRPFAAAARVHASVAAIRMGAGRLDEVEASRHSRGENARLSEPGTSSSLQGRHSRPGLGSLRRNSMRCNRCPSWAEGSLLQQLRYGGACRGCPCRRLLRHDTCSRKRACVRCAAPGVTTAASIGPGGVASSGFSRFSVSCPFAARIAALGACASRALPPWCEASGNFSLVATLAESATSCRLPLVGVGGSARATASGSAGASPLREAHP